MGDGKRQLLYNVFWDEIKSFEESVLQLSEEDNVREEDLDADWLSDAGFPSILDKVNDNTEISLLDKDLIAITESLTHTQAAAVRKRIESLNETIRKKRQSQNGRYTDVRSLFPTQTEAESSDVDFVFTAQVRSQPVNDTTNKQLKQQSDDPVGYDEQEPQVLGNTSHLLRSARTLEPIFYGVTTPEKPLQIQRAPKAEPENQPKIAKSSPGQFWKGIAHPPPPRRTVSEGVQLLKVRKRNDDDSQWQESQLNNALLSPTAQQKLGYVKGESRRQGQREAAEVSRRQSIPSLTAKESNAMLASPANANRRHSSNASLASPSDFVENNSKFDLRNGIQPDSAEVKNEERRNADAKLSIGSSNLRIPGFGDDSSFPPLPNFTLTKEQLGMTRVKDLSEADMLKVRSLALIELTALLDSYNIPMNRRKGTAKTKQKETGIFGVCLNILAQRDEKAKSPECKAPNFVQEMLSFLEVNGLKEEGLLRVTGSAQRIKMLREEIEDRYCDAGFFSWNGRRATDVANLLKQFLRELPTPLVTREYQNTFASVADLPERKLQLQALNLLVLLLPAVHRDTLKLLLVFLNKVIDFENYNKMGLNNVAMIIAPNLFFNSSTKADMESVAKAAVFTDIMRMLIKYHKILWTVPGFMVSQIRYLYEAGTKTRDPKAVKKVIAKRMRDTANGPLNTRGKSFSSGDEVDGPEIEEGCIIRIKAPMMDKTCMAMHVYENTTVADLISKFRWRRHTNRRNSDDDYLSPGHKENMSKSDTSLDREGVKQFSLYEVGGNIGERRLDSSTNVLALMRVNPNAEWILRS